MFVEYTNRYYSFPPPNGPPQSESLNTTLTLNVADLSLGVGTSTCRLDSNFTLDHLKISSAVSVLQGKARYYECAKIVPDDTSFYKPHGQDYSTEVQALDRCSTCPEKVRSSLAWTLFLLTRPHP